MNHYKEIEHLTNCFHYSTDIPLIMLYKNEIESTLPNDVNTAEKLIKGTIVVPKYSIEEKHLQVVTNIYKEKYLVLNLSLQDCTLVAGPIIDERIEFGNLTNMVREGLVPFHDKSIIQDYYQNAFKASEKKLYFISRLFENMFSSLERKKEINIEETSKENEEPSSFVEIRIQDRNNDFLHSPYEIELEICKTISDGNSEIAKNILRQINLQPHAKLASTTLRSYKNSMICSCSFMTRAAIQGGVNPNDAFTLSDFYINQIENCSSLNELEFFESKMIEGFTERVRNIKSQNYSPQILNTIYYIDNHLCDDLNITSLSKVAYLNPSYLSSLFHKETGQTITEWINRKRIQEAAHFVKNTTEDFAEIAFMYHFCSQSYFVQCFKKIMGVTPGEYRRNKE